jgi:hypothetical protein
VPGEVEEIREKIREQKVQLELLKKSRTNEDEIPSISLVYKPSVSYVVAKEPTNPSQLLTRSKSFHPKKPPCKLCHIFKERDKQNFAAYNQSQATTTEATEKTPVSFHIPSKSVVNMSYATDDDKRGFRTCSKSRIRFVDRICEGITRFHELRNAGNSLSESVDQITRDAKIRRKLKQPEWIKTELFQYSNILSSTTKGKDQALEDSLLKLYNTILSQTNISHQTFFGRPKRKPLPLRLTPVNKSRSKKEGPF